MKKIVCLIILMFFIVGCADEITTNDGVIECKAEQRNVDACIEIYQPVCGKVNVQCITAPCDPVLETFENSCKACANSLVSSYTEGKCFTDDSVVLMQHSTEGYYACFGCNEPSEGAAMCIDPIPAMKLVQETEERYCNSNFEVVER